MKIELFYGNHHCALCHIQAIAQSVRARKIIVMEKNFRKICNNEPRPGVLCLERMIRDLKFTMHCRRYSDDVYRFARSLLGNNPDAEDATQEVLLRLWKHLDSIQRADVRPWLLRTTRNYCFDQIRRRHRSDHLTEASEAALAVYPDDLAVDPSRAADWADFRKLIDSALERLPESLRSVFILYEVNGLRYREVAETLEIPINSVKVYLARARSQLKEHLTHQETCLKI